MDGFGSNVFSTIGSWGSEAWPMAAENSKKINLKVILLKKILSKIFDPLT